jgi:hypothetical protein
MLFTSPKQPAATEAEKLCFHKSYVADGLAPASIVGILLVLLCLFGYMLSSQFIIFSLSGTVFMFSYLFYVCLVKHKKYM